MSINLTTSVAAVNQARAGWRTRLVIALCLAAMAVGCSRNDSSGRGDLSGRLTITGSSTVAPLIGEIANRFEDKHPGVRIDVQTGGSSRGITDAQRGTADIGMSSRALKDSEADGVTSHLLARDGVAILVHATNPLTNLTDEQVRAIYTKQVTRWIELGGPDAPITVINRADGRAELEVLSEYLGLKPADFRADLVSGENQHGIKAVAGDPHAIIYMSIGASEYAIGQGEPLKLLRWNGIESSAKSVAGGEFPVSRPLILITPREPSALSQAFLNYALSDQVHDLIDRFSYVAPQR